MRLTRASRVLDGTDEDVVVGAELEDGPRRRHVGEEAVEVGQARDPDRRDHLELGVVGDEVALARVLDDRLRHPHLPEVVVLSLIHI